MKKLLIILMATFCLTGISTINADVTSFNGTFVQPSSQFIKSNNIRVAVFCERNANDLQTTINNWFKKYPNVHIISIQYQVSNTNGFMWQSALVTYYIN